jgi:hypothetical protein
MSTDAKPETWTRWVALSMAIMAVGAGVLTLYMGKYSSRAMMTQGKITNQWSYFQAKSIKQHACETHRMQLELTRIERGGAWNPEVRAAFDEALTTVKKEIARYKEEKAAIQADAEKMEGLRDAAQQRGGKLSYALILAQIGIMLSSVTLIAKKRPLWYLGMALIAVSLVIVGAAFNLL